MPIHLYFSVHFQSIATWIYDSDKYDINTNAKGVLNYIPSRPLVAKVSTFFLIPCHWMPIHLYFSVHFQSIATWIYDSDEYDINTNARHTIQD